MFAPNVTPAVKGTLPTDVRYRVRNADGSISTVRTMSIGTDQGEVLIPTVIGGKVVSDNEAIRHFEQTGESFGTFKSVADADQYAQALHGYHDQILQGERKPQSSNPSGFAPRGLPGETVTSTRRSPKHNRDVGGVTNSYHLSGRARDSTPPPGMSMSAYAAQLRRMNPQYEVINEGDHVHIEPRG